MIQRSLKHHQEALRALEFELFDPHPRLQQQAFVVSGVASSDRSQVLRHIKLWGPWDPDRDRWHHAAWLKETSR